MMLPAFTKKSELGISCESREHHGSAEAVLFDRKSTRLNSSHGYISYPVFCLKKKFYMLLWRSRINLAVFGVFLTLQITEVLLAIGFWVAAHRGVAPTGVEVGWIRAGGRAGFVTAAVAWYASAALVLSAMNDGQAILPVGKGFWTGGRFSFGQRRRLGQASAG